MKREMEERVEPLEERWVEVKPVWVEHRPLDKAAADRVDAVGHGDARVKRSLGLDQPAAGRNVARRVDAFAHVGPELIEVISAREQAPDANNRNRVVWLHDSTGW